MNTRPRSISSSTIFFQPGNSFFNKTYSSLPFSQLLYPAYINLSITANNFLKGTMSTVLLKASKIRSNCSYYRNQLSHHRKTSNYFDNLFPGKSTIHIFCLCSWSFSLSKSVLRPCKLTGLKFPGFLPLSLFMPPLLFFTYKVLHLLFSSYKILN